MRNKDVFISYKSEEVKEAEWLRSKLEKSGISCWMAPSSLSDASAYSSEVTTAIKNCKALVFVMSEKSQTSKWTLRELDYAVNEDKAVYQYKIEKCELKDEYRFYLSSTKSFAAYENKDSAVNKLIHEIKEKFSLNNDDEPFVIPGISDAGNQDEKKSEPLDIKKDSDRTSLQFDIPEILREKELPKKKKSKSKIVWSVLAGAFALLVLSSIIFSRLNEVKIAGTVYDKDDSTVYVRDYEVTPEDIEAIQKLENVTFIQFTDCSFPTEDLSWIPESVDTLMLNNCNLNNKHIESIDFESLALTSVNIDDNKNITDLSELSVLGSSATSLSFSGCSVSDISFVSELNKLKSVYFDSNNVEDISALSGCTGLQIISINSNNIKSLAPLGKCTALTEVYANSNKITSLNGLQSATRLKTLEIDNNSVTDFSALKSSSYISKLSVKSNSTETPIDLSFVSSFAKTLTELYIDGNAIKDYSPIGECIKLKKLTLNNCKNVKSFDFLKSCIKLTHLYASGCDIESLSGLENLTKIYYLDVSSNKLTSVESLPSFNSSAYLDISNNNISSIVMPKCRLRSFILYGNPVTQFDFSSVSGNSIAIGYYPEYNYGLLLGSFSEYYIIDCPAEAQVNVTSKVPKAVFMTAAEYVELRSE